MSTCAGVSAALVRTGDLSRGGGGAVLGLGRGSGHQGALGASTLGSSLEAKGLGIRFALRNFVGDLTQPAEGRSRGSRHLTFSGE